MTLMVKSGKGGDENLNKIVFCVAYTKNLNKMRKGKYVSKIETVIMYVGEVN